MHASSRQRNMFLSFIGIMALLIVTMAATAATSFTGESDNNIPVTSYERFAVIAREVPEFSGAYRDGDVLKIRLTDTSKLEEAKQAIIDHYGPNVIGKGGVAAEQAGYDMGSLVRWRRAMGPIPGIQAATIDQKSARIVWWIKDDAGADYVRNRMRELGIPEGAVDIRVGKATFIPQDSLNDYHRPLAGGQEVQYLPPSATPRACTYGVNTELSGTKGMLTAGHCSDGGLGSDGSTEFYQLSYTQSSQKIANETENPAFMTQDCDVWISEADPDDWCRWSDSLWAAFDTGTNPTYDFGKIYKTQSGNKTIAGTYRITSRGNPFPDDPVTMVGKTSGTTSGTVDFLCADTPIGQLPDGTVVWLICVEWANYTSANGDSGSPIFNVTNDPSSNDVEFIGIHDGIYQFEGQWYAVYSYIGNIDLDISGLTYCYSGYSCS